VDYCVIRKNKIIFAQVIHKNATQVNIFYLCDVLQAREAGQGGVAGMLHQLLTKEVIKR
jgi:hypothetical protein